MLASAMTSLGGVPSFLIYLVASFVLVALFILIYTLLTPHREIALIREGNTSAAVCLGGAILGFAIPLSKSISQSHDLADMLVWSVVALIVQLVVFLLSGLVIAHESHKIVEGDLATAAFLAFAAVSAGLVTSACMTY